MPRLDHAAFETPDLDGRQFEAITYESGGDPRRLRATSLAMSPSGRAGLAGSAVCVAGQERAI